MRRFPALIIILAFIIPALAAPPPLDNAPWPEAGLRWIKNYRKKPDPAAVPAVIRALSQHGAIKDADTSGVYVGFLAGVLHSNPTKARALIEKILPLPFEDQWFVIRAVAYSGLPNWQDLMRTVSVRMPHRQVMAERYLTGKLPVLDEVQLEPRQRSTMQKMKAFFTFHSEKPAQHRLTFESNPDLIDVLWGIYFATGKEGPIARIIVLLAWSKERDNVQKLTVGSMAKFTLAANAAKDAELLALLKRAAPYQSKETAPILNEVIEAAEIADTGRIGKEALAAVEQLKTKGPASTRDMAWWGQAGELSLSLGCLGLAVAGQVEFGVPCVVGGALSTAALRYFSKPE